MNIWLTLHIAGVVIFVGNIVTAAFWKMRADATKNPTVIHHAAKNVMLADYMFTLPGLALVVVSGSVMAARSGIALSGMNWLTVSLIIFAVTGVIWAVVLIPMQRKMIRGSYRSIDSGAVTAEYVSASRVWAAFGTVSTLLPIAILYLMIAKGF